MYVGGPLDTAPATSSSTLSRSQASHREVKVRKVNPSHSVSPPVLEYREVDRIATETGLQGLDHPEGNYPLSLSLSVYILANVSVSVHSWSLRWSADLGHRTWNVRSFAQFFDSVFDGRATPPLMNRISSWTRLDRLGKLKRSSLNAYSRAQLAFTLNRNVSNRQ